MLCNENNLFHCQGIFWRHFSYGNFSLDFNAPSECVKQTLFCFFFNFAVVWYAAVLRLATFA